MRLKELLKGVPLVGGTWKDDTEITGISCDTRTMRPGDLFAALPGYKADGQDFIPQALERGAAAVLCRKAPAFPGPWLVAEDPRAAMALLSANWFGHPAEKLTCVAVTGTNGKTTTTYLLKAVLERVPGARVGLIGTNQNLIGDRVLPASRTTPESLDLQALLRDMADAGCTHVVMEASSIALDQRRTFGIRFAAAIFTNLTEDHLDYHGTMESYRRAKGLLFQQTDLAVLNLDDEAGAWYAENVGCPIFTYSERKDRADLVAKDLRLFPSHVEFEAVAKNVIGRIFLPIPGGFSIYNALGVIACALNLGVGMEHIAAALRSVSGVKGRVEVVPVPAAYTVIIDYAHTPDALENILTTVRDLTDRRVLCLFGCGGDRDRTKRPVMGAIAAALADLVVVTSDNPRTEEPAAIMADILRGMEGTDTPVEVEPDRVKAIQRVLALAGTGDVVVLAGKGHETYQEVGEERLPLDEREVVARCFASGAVSAKKGGFHP
ncbi:UDP-N-acetylmuramoyl-L-alanyl-D-glutamate--2,6-diaminopimelate ligase [Intestinimonas sp.]|uniref:UDP-N-acetylmuramoyl-L-alanyl-D-glutamate--2, 6-diaminopimelate ligase n=1 Tax=Intestinimonas sp. TaxID=1965293 RepID=UPI0026195B11|nr:UDP-N-acetylmuramoyl-L-alanyl-D-glutamate--2,6-diaminopimelate ligase [Intestinimonas sp.]